MKVLFLRIDVYFLLFVGDRRSTSINTASQNGSVYLSLEFKRVNITFVQLREPLLARHRDRVTVC